MTRTLLLAAIFGFFYRGYTTYSQEDRFNGPDMGPFWDFVHGVGPAPFQYRIGVLRLSGWLYQHYHWPLRYGYSLFDLLASTIALLLGYELLRNRSVYKNATLSLQWFASAAYLALAVYLVCWQDFYKKPETEPAAALAMLLFWLWSPREEAGPRFLAGRNLLTGALILLLTLATSLIRADLALSIGLGVFAVALLPSRGNLALPRQAALALSAASVLLAAGTQLVMMKVIYPHARPYVGSVCMLPSEFRHPYEFLIFASYILPAAWALLEARRQRFTADAAGLAALFACIPFTALWIGIGRVEEVRIFLPLALAIAPITVEFLLRRLDATAPASQLTP